jgi:hypothetical protein
LFNTLHYLHHCCMMSLYPYLFTHHNSVINWLEG